MSFKRRRFNRGNRFNFRRRRFDEKKVVMSTAPPSATALKALREVRKLKRSVEKKFVFKVSQTLVVTDAGSVISFSPAAQGDGESERNGNQMLVTGVGMRMTALLNGSATETVLRVIVFVDKRQVTDTAPSVASVLQQVRPLSYLNGIRHNRFKVLFDKTFALEVASNAFEFVKFWTKLNLLQKYNGAATGDIEKNGIWLLTVADEVTNDPSLTFQGLLTFTDA